MHISQMYKPSSALQQKITIGFVYYSDDIPGSFLPVFSFNGFQIGEPQTIVSHKSGRSGSVRLYVSPGWLQSTILSGSSIP